MTFSNQISEMDKNFLGRIRTNVTLFLEEAAKQYDKEEALLLDIAPQDHSGAAPYFNKSRVCTLDIDPASGATYIADICKTNSFLINDNFFDFVVCTEVLEHTLDPFGAINEIYRILKPNGYIFMSTPFNFRIHGPLPDCWRFTIHGLKVLLKDFNISKIQEHVVEDRWLMPLQYTLIAQKPAVRK